MAAARGEIVASARGAIGTDPVTWLIDHAVDVAAAGALVGQPGLPPAEIDWMSGVITARGLPADLAAIVAAAVDDAVRRSA